MAGLAEFVGQAEQELAGNAMLCAIHQAVYLLKRQIESQGRQFMEQGGFTERLYRERTRYRRESRNSDSPDQQQKSDMSHASDKPDGPNIIREVGTTW